MTDLKVLRLRIYQPQAHYRMPFTYQRRHTYPIPPYSTVIGFLCNVLGINDQQKEAYQKLRKIKISIAGRFAAKTTEYVWFRNLSIRSHEGRFGRITNRSIGGEVEHIGGQSPILMDVLEEVRLVIHLAHEAKEFLESILDALYNPRQRLEVLHLGRAEDWLVLEEISDIMDASSFPFVRRDGNYGHFFWIPERMYLAPLLAEPQASGNFAGLAYRLPTFWRVAGFEQTRNRHGRRIFEYVTAILNEGLFTRVEFLFDEACRLPVFLAELESPEEGAERPETELFSNSKS